MNNKIKNEVEFMAHWNTKYLLPNLFFAMMVVVLMVIVGCGQSASTAGNQTPQTTDKPVESPKSDSIEKLAKTEGKVVVYATGGSTAESVIPSFQKKYPGIEVQVVTLRGPEMSTRVDAEYASGKHVVDIIFTGPGSMLAFRNQDRFLKWEPKDTDKIFDGANDPKGYYWGTYLNIYGMVVNTDILKEDVPKKWKDLVDPRYKGKILLDDPRTQGGGQFFAIGASKEPNLGWDYLKSLKSQVAFNRDRNESPRMVARGEYAVYAPQAVNDEITNVIKSGAPVKLIFPEDGAIYIPVQSGVLNKAPHPNAAKLLIEYMLSEEGQVVIAEKGKVYPARKQVQGPPGWPDISGNKYLPVVTEEDLKKNPENVKRFEELFFK
jgi:iron(III) transport system substrate-binding protein